MILWKLWAGVPVVKLWEAVALVLEIEPSDLKGEPQSWMNGRSGGPFFDPRSFPSRDKQASFDKALSFAERAANAAGPIYLRAGLARGMNKRTAQVSLNEVVAFFVACEWPNIPAPLLALVSGAVSTPADNAAEPVAAAVPSIAPLGNATTNPTTRFLSNYARLTPTTSWTGGRLTDADLVTLEEAARFASRHSGTEVTPSDFLRAAARGEILLRAVSPRDATMQPTQVDREPLHIPAGSLPTLPLAACKALSITGRACWRSIDRPEQLAAFGGAWGYFTAWSLPDAEPDLETMVSECRVAGLDVHALADAFSVAALLPAPDAAKVVDGKRGPGSVADDAPATMPVPAATSSTRHSLRRRSDPLAAVLADAKQKALDQANWQSVWAALVELAESVSRPPPLRGYVEGEGVQYRTDDASQPVGYLTREAFRKRFSRS